MVSSPAADVWVTVEQDPTGLWWTTTDTGTTTGPYLDEVQATRTLPPGVVVHITTTAPPLQCALQTPTDRPVTNNHGMDG